MSSKNKTISILLISCLLASVQMVNQSDAETVKRPSVKSSIEVYLPREVTINDNAPSLGQVSIIRGQESLIAKASEVALGRISVPGQKIVIDRPMVLSRLACNGIPASKVTFTGAEKVTVKQQQQIIKGSEFVKLASSFLKENPPANSVCQFAPIRIPKDLVLPGAREDIKLSPRLAASTARNSAKVQIAVFADGQRVGLREVTFRLKYNCRRAVALVDIGAGTILSSENIKIENAPSNYPEPANWRPPYGLIAKRHLPANTVLRSHMTGAATSAVVVNRNQTVIIRVENPGFLATAIGKAMQQAKAGEYIKVRNVDSQRIIVVKVNEDGSVEPVF